MRDEFFKDYRFLLPASKQKELEQLEQLSPKKQTLSQNKAAIEGN
jgi:hypothetical protein